MSAKNRILDELNRLTQVGGLTNVQSIAVDCGNGTLTCDIVAVDQLACAFEKFSFQAPSLASATLEQLDRVATQLSQRLSYLLESISPVEKDKDGCVVQMRSNPPQKDDDGTSYYELVVRRGELALCRFSKASGQVRRVIPTNVTREVFCRLAADFAAVV